MTPSHARQRLDFAMRHANKDDNFWDKLVCEDEKYFGLKGPHTGSLNNYVRCHSDERIDRENVNEVPGDQEFLFYAGWISAEGVGDLVEIDLPFTGLKYADILKGKYIRSLPKMLLTKASSILLMDNDPRHKSNVVSSKLREKRINVLNFPPMSGDLNPIENVWSILQSRVQARKPHNLNQLRSMLQEEWAIIDSDKELLRNLIRSMPRRLNEVILRDGWYTRY